MLFAVLTFASGVNSTWYARSWQSDDGLPDNSVSGVAQTSDGYLWVATAGGLMRFDGARFKEFPLANLEGVPNRVVRALLLDRRGQLWLGMDRGPVVCIAPKSTKVFSRGLPDARAVCMVDDGQGDVWITYGDGGLTRIQPDGQIKVFGAADGWTAEEDPIKVEHAVGALMSRRDWTIVSHEVIFHGRRVCHARKPACGACTLAADCPSYGTGPTDLVEAAALVKGPSRTRLLGMVGIADEDAPAPAGGEGRDAP